MTLKIIHKNNTSAGQAPAPSDLDIGEIAVNSADAKLFTKDTNGAVREFIGKFEQSGSGVVARSIESKLRDVVSVKDFGAVGDGATDDTVAIQAAVDAVSPYGKVVIPEGTYNISSAIRVTKSGVEISLDSAKLVADNFTGWTLAGGSVFDGGRNKALIEFVGESILKTTSSDSSLSKGDFVVNLSSTTGIQLGDLLFLNTDEPWYQSATKSELFKIIKISGTAVTVDHPFDFDYDFSGYTETVEVIRPVVDCKIYGGVIEGEGLVDSNLLNGFGPCGVNACGTINFCIENVTIKYFQNRSLALDWSYFCTAKDLYLVGLPDSVDYAAPEAATTGISSFYAVYVKFSFCVNLDGIKGYRVRHTTDGDYSHNLSIKNCYATVNHKSSYRAHEGLNDVHYDNCFSLNNLHYGMQWEGFDITVTNCTFISSDGSGGLYAATVGLGGLTADPQRRIVFQNNTLAAGTRSFYMSCNAYGLLQGNTFINNGAGTSGTVLLGGDNIDGLKIESNKFEDPVGSRSIQLIDGGTNGNYIYFLNNNFNYQGFSAPIVIQATVGYVNDELNVIAVGNSCPSGMSKAQPVVDYPGRNGGVFRTDNNYAQSIPLENETPFEINGTMGVPRGTGGYLFLETPGGGERASIKSNSSNELIFSAGSADNELVRLSNNNEILKGYDDALTNFGTATTSPTTTNTTPKTQLHAGSAAGAGAAFVSWKDSDDAFYAPTLWLAKANAPEDTVGLNSSVNDGTDLGAILFAGNDGTNFINAAGIYAEVDGTPSTDSMPGRLVFAVTASGNDNITRTPGAITINSDQEVLVGYSADNGNYKLQVNSQIFATSATIATSDARYKENVSSLDSCLDLVKSFRPISFEWKDQEDIIDVDDEGNEVIVREKHNFPEGVQVGFIAQEVAEVLKDKPWLESIIKENKRPEVKDKDGNVLAKEEQFLGIAEGNLIAVLTRALQETVDRLELLEKEISAFKQGG